MHPVGGGKIYGRHGTVERHQPRGVVQPGQQRGHVAVADEDFGMPADHVQIKVRQ